MSMLLYIRCNRVHSDPSITWGFFLSPCWLYFTSSLIIDFSYYLYVTMTGWIQRLSSLLPEPVEIQWLQQNSGIENDNDSNTINQNEQLHTSITSYHWTKK